MEFSAFPFDENLREGILSSGYKTATPVQEQVIPIILEGRDLIASAQTGTGKTAAFLLPLINLLIQEKQHDHISALIIVPTRELAIQIAQHMEGLSYFTDVSFISVYGGGDGNAFIEEKRALSRGADVVICTPGKMISHLNMGYVKLKQLKYLVLDEADRMLDMGFLDDILRIINHTPKERQTLLFSATMPDEIRLLTKEVLRDPLIVQIGLAAPAATVSHALYPVPQHLKTPLLAALLQEAQMRSVLVFTRTKHRARRVADQLQQAGFRATSLQGNLSQNQREAALRGFRAGSFEVMVATDIAARGLDVVDISHVINYDMPDTTDAYTHRIGRTGRAERTGEAFTFITPEDTDAVRAVERALNGRLERRTVPGFNYKAAAPPAPPTPAPTGYRRRRSA